MAQPINSLASSMVDVQHKTKPDVIPISFYIFKDSTRPFTLLPYSASIHLEILEFKVSNEARSYKINAISKQKSVSFNTPLCYSKPTGNYPKAVREAEVSPEAKHHWQQYFLGPSFTTGTSITGPFFVISGPFPIITGPFCSLPRPFLH